MELRTDIANWRIPPRHSCWTAHSPMALGVQLCYRSKSPWPGGFATSRSNGGSRSKCHWIEQHSDSNGNLAPSPSDRIKLTQRIILSGSNAAAYTEQVKAGFGPTLASGMEALAAAMVAAEKAG